LRGQGASCAGFLRQSLRRGRRPHHRAEPERGTDGRPADDAARPRETGRARASGVMKLTDFSRKPNVVILITDQERQVMHWPAGWAEASLPARRRLMERGLTFTRAQCNTAACSSSRATFFTGLYPAQHGVKNLVACNNYGDTAQRRLNILSSRLP